MCNFAKNIDFISASVYDNENVPSGGGKMKSKDVISAALKEIGISQAEGAKRIDWSPQQLCNKVVAGTLRADDFLRLMDAIGVDVEFKVRDTGNVIKPRRPGAGRRVRCMVNKVIYDTAASDAVANNFYADGVNEYTDGRARELYVDKEGRYFFAEYSTWEGQKDLIIPVGAAEAAAFVEKYGDIIFKTPVAECTE